MTRNTSARVAGVTFLLYIVVGVGQMFVGKGATSGVGTAARLASVAAHAPQIRLNLLLTMLICVIALTLAVALYGITRDEDQELSMLGLACRIVEGGVTPVVAMLATLGLLWLAAPEQANAADAAASYPLAAFLLKLRGWTPLIGATFFSVGSAIFCWLFVRGRMIPAPLAWLGVAASLLLVVCLPLQLTGMLTGSFTQLMWIPMALFEIPLGFWLIFKGVPDLRVRSATAIQ